MLLSTVKTTALVNATPVADGISDFSARSLEVAGFARLGTRCTLHEILVVASRLPLAPLLTVQKILSHLDHFSASKFSTVVMPGCPLTGNLDMHPPALQFRKVPSGSGNPASIHFRLGFCGRRTTRPGQWHVRSVVLPVFLRHLQRNINSIAGTESHNCGSGSEHAIFWNPQIGGSPGTSSKPHHL